jgi:hypothetical protein
MQELQQLPRAPWQITTNLKFVSFKEQKFIVSQSGGWKSEVEVFRAPHPPQFLLPASGSSRNSMMGGHATHLFPQSLFSSMASALSLL